jgi:hypothetical protein
VTGVVGGAVTGVVGVVIGVAGAAVVDDAGAGPFVGDPPSETPELDDPRAPFVPAVATPPSAGVAGLPVAGAGG